MGGGHGFPGLAVPWSSGLGAARWLSSDGHGHCCLAGTYAGAGDAAAAPGGQGDGSRAGVSLCLVATLLSPSPAAGFVRSRGALGIAAHDPLVVLQTRQGGIHPGIHAGMQRDEQRAVPAACPDCASTEGSHLWEDTAGGRGAGCRYPFPPRALLPASEPPAARPGHRTTRRGTSEGRAQGLSPQPPAPRAMPTLGDTEQQPAARPPAAQAGAGWPGLPRHGASTSHTWQEAAVPAGEGSPELPRGDGVTPGKSKAAKPGQPGSTARHNPAQPGTAPALLPELLGPCCG